MKHNETNKELVTLRTNLESLPVADLRKHAHTNFGLKLTRDHSKDDIISLIVGIVAKGNYASLAEGEIKPGWARIKLAATNDYRSAIPVHINANGFTCFIPFGVEVDVPIRVLESLNNAVEFRPYETEFGEKAYKFNDSYPYQLVGKVDGPDPRPGLEVGREARLRPKIRFREQFGFFPTDKALRDFIQSGMFRLDPEELKIKTG